VYKKVYKKTDEVRSSTNGWKAKYLWGVSISKGIKENIGYDYLWLREI